MSVIASRVVELVKSLPEADQKAICAALAERKMNFGTRPRRQLQRISDGSYFNSGGIPNEDPIFKVLEEIEQQRHNTQGPEAPEFS
jgi:hypothetical protein